MMLHEAVMLEIYRQALNASELASPRCHSRESNGSGTAGEGRCPSNDSHCSTNDFTPGATPIPTTPPVGLPLQATAAAATLLPPQSAAMAAYLNAAAAAAQQNHLLLTNPLAAAASFVQQATQAHSPIDGGKSSPTISPRNIDAPALDFSTKYTGRMSRSGSGEEEDESERIKKGPESEENEDEDADGDGDENGCDDGNAPLDLSLNTSRKRLSENEEVPPMRKTPRPSDYKPLTPVPWATPINPYLAAVAAASLSPKASGLDCWNNKQKYAPNEATKALEKMTEMTRLGAVTSTEGARSGSQGLSTTGASTTTSSNGRHSAWQSHWLTKGADAVKDVFKCVWCKQSFPTLASLTLHMKETQHCGVNVPAAVAAGSVNSSANINANSNSNTGSNSISTASHHASRHSNTQSSNGGNGSGSNNISSSSNAVGSAVTTSNSKSDLNLLIKETMPLPRKLVRGQDVWLGKGAEQTRQILKCMWCGQSFRSLAEMTSHMQETQHYTNIISQEQIISWKSSDEKSNSSGNGIAGSSSSNTNASGAISVATAAVNTAVSAVLTCKVCDQAFPTLKELSNHMIKNSHYKEHMIRGSTGSLECSMPNNTSPNSNASRRGGRQLRGEKRKKSLPVRKLLEMERAQHDFKLGNSSLDSALKPLRDFAASTKITCEKCGDKIETALFVDHIRQCLGGHIPMSPRHSINNNNNNSITANNNNNNNNLKRSHEEQQINPKTPQSNQSDGRKTADIEMTSPLTSSSRSEILCPLPKDGEKSTSSTPSVLNAIEQLIEKSFDTRMRGSNSSYGTSGGGSKPSTPLGSSILKRLGIDDNIDYTKPLMESQAMHFLRSYSSYSAPRDRSASESSSISERCSSRLESSVTPERSIDRSRQATPRLMTPEKPVMPSAVVDSEEQKIKTELNIDSGDAREIGEPKIQIKTETIPSPQIQKISVKKEFSMTEIDEKKYQNEDEVTRGPAIPNAISPSPSERSLTPKSTSSQSKTPINSAVANSLNALSSMFDSLNNGINLSSTEANNNHTSNGGKKSSANPLAALQKLCEKTKDQPAANTRSGPVPLNTAAGSNGNSLGNMVAFSWACNDGVMSSPDALIKCSYCDLPFSSKGAYRHHLSKVHFIKDDSVERNSIKSPGLTTSPKSLPASSPKRCNSKSPITQRQSVSPASSVGNILTPTINPYDESPQSKFLKYTELAKQLSSKNV